MSPSSPLKGWRSSFDRPGLRSVLAGIETANFVLRHRQRRTVRYRDGMWVHAWDGVRYPSDSPVRPADCTRWERRTLDIFCHEVTPGPGEVVLDVGAGFGSEAITFSRLVGPTGRVVAIEAHPATFARLEAVIAANPTMAANVTAVHAAVSDAPGELSMTDDDEGGYLNNSVVARGERTTTVPATTLDALVEDLGIESVALIKMNIEGAERPAMLGMTRTLAMTRHVAISCHDFLAEETGDDSLRTRDAVRPALEAAGFAITQRPDDRRSYVRDYLYGTRIEGTSGET